MTERIVFERLRCSWATAPESIVYHDEEWGMPQHDDRMLFELLTLEGAQAGLSWLTVLRKRDGYRAAFQGFDPTTVSQFAAATIDELVLDPRIVRHRGKIAATVTNAAAFLGVQHEFGSFANYLWRFVDGQPVLTHRPLDMALPATTPLSDRISVDLKQRGFGFVGPTIVYAYLQATGVVNDHAAECFRASVD